MTSTGKGKRGKKVDMDSKNKKSKILLWTNKKGQLRGSNWSAERNWIENLLGYMADQLTNTHSSEVSIWCK